MRRRRGFRSGRGPGRRKLVWATYDQDSSIAANLNWINVDLLAEYKGLVGASTAGITIMRSHIAFWPTSAVTNGDGIYLGLKVDDLNQVTPAATSDAMVTNPFDDSFEDWMLVRKFNAHPSYSFTAANNNILLDVKSKRKMEEVQQALIFSVYSQDVNTLPFTFDIHARILLALP